MWSRLGMSSTCAPGMILPSACAEPAISSDGADRDQGGHGDPGGFLLGHQPPRAAQAGGERAAVGAGLVGERAKGPPHRIGHLVERGRLERCGDILAGAAALDQRHADAAENRRAQPVGMAQRQPRRHPRAERIAHDIGAVDFEMVHQRGHVAGHGRDVIGLRVVELAGIAVAAIVERDDAAAAFLQFGNPGRIDPVDVLGRGEAVHQHDRLALAFVEIGNFNGAVMKTRHLVFPAFWEIEG